MILLALLLASRVHVTPAVATLMSEQSSSNVRGTWRRVKRAPARRWASKILGIPNLKKTDAMECYYVYSAPLAAIVTHENSTEIYVHPSHVCMLSCEGDMIDTLPHKKTRRRLAFAVAKSRVSECPGHILGSRTPSEMLGIGPSRYRTMQWGHCRKSSRFHSALLPAAK